MWPLIKQIKIFSGILTIIYYFKSNFFSIIYAQATRMPPQDFPFWEKSLQGQIYKKKTVEVNNTVETTSY